MRLILLLAMLLPWPPALSLSSAELQRGQAYTATATAPAGSVVALQLPPGLSASLLDRQGDTVIWRLTVADDAPLSRTPRQVVLLIDGRAAATASVRIWTEEVRRFDLWLPVVLQKRE
jgi:hypothetical protein